MKRTIIILSLFLSILIIVYGLLRILPYHFYFKSLQQGIHSSYLEIKLPKNLNDQFITPKKYIKRKNNNLNLENWQKIYLENFELFLPLKDPNYIILPNISSINKSKTFGLDFFNLTGQEIMKYELLQDGLFQYDFKNNKVFNLPYFKNYILEKPLAIIWKDVFSKDLNILKLKNKFSFFHYFKYIKYDYRKLVYNLYILYLRVNYFNNSLMFSSFQSGNNNLKTSSLGVIRVLSKNEHLYHSFIISRLMKQKFFRIKVTIKINEKRSTILKEELLENIFFKKDSIDSAIESYSYFKHLSFDDKISQVGMISLFSAWSHDKKNDQYLKEIIFWLEKNEKNLKILSRFYDYAYKQFGTNLSNIKSRLHETEEVRIERLMTEEQLREFSVEQKIEKNEADFETPESLIMYNLKNAKLKKKKPVSKKIRMH